MDINNQLAKIKVICVGGGGNNAVNRMLEHNIKNVEFFIANTDVQVLHQSKLDSKIALGKTLTKGLGAGGNPDIGKKAALESEKTLLNILQDTDMLFIAAGMGGGTGTGAAPIIAKLAKDLGILTVGVVTTPFSFEGKKRNSNALEGIDELMKNVDSLISVSNDRLIKLIGGLPLKESFQEADKVLAQAIETITDLIATPALINLDFADVCSVMRDKGNSLIGIGHAKGDDKAKDAALKAISSPLLEVSVAGAKDAIINVTGGPNVSLLDANIVLETITSQVGNDLNTYLGISINEDLGDEIIVTIIATGLKDTKNKSVENQSNIAEVIKTNKAKYVYDLQSSKESTNKQTDDLEIPNFFKKRSSIYY